MMRLQKYLAQCGIGSRRACEQLIADGRIRVNGQVVRRLGTTIDPTRDRVEADGRAVRPEAPVVIAVNKPIGLICTSHDPQGRPTVVGALAGTRSVSDDPWPAGRLYTIGRLDADSEGLLLLTNDGELAHRLMHPRHHVPRVYRVWVRGRPSAEQLRQFIEGVEYEGETLRAQEVRVLQARSETTCCRVILKEGRKRQIRRMFEVLGLPVARLRRTDIGPLSLGRLPIGGWRFLRPEEMAGLRLDWTATSPRN
ncbi:MAG TPA: pseudouridine synthase [Kiritimatiellia bacterium]|nr:pseudouridine synthase [Kiritimatiellia bacterium]HRZ13180.1 pseudouridine synthase [Kiritimatiellia bacterium]HSA17601.1 pseudouridine synthase [Kiritimatiellia bacterium]